MNYETLDIIETIFEGIHKNIADYTLDEAMDYILNNYQSEDFGFGVDNRLVPGVGRVIKYYLLKK